MKKEILFTTLSALLAGTSCSTRDDTREKLDRMLDNLAKQPAPDDLATGAMCYDMVPPLERYEYVCPTCHSKTIHADRNSGVLWLLSWKLKSYREHVATINKLGITATLDESSLCETCLDGLKEKPKPGDVFLNVVIDGKTTHSKINDYDLVKLVAFLQKKDRWQNAQGWETAIKDDMPRIRELLGMTEATKNDE